VALIEWRLDTHSFANSWERSLEDAHAQSVTLGNQSRAPCAARLAGAQDQNTAIAKFAESF